jgi:acetoin utilization deacetylase AcuC-like enzyme
MKVVYSPLHRRHAPPQELDSGVPVPMVETPQRAEVIRRALEADGGFQFLRPQDHGEEPITALHDPAMVGYLKDAWTAWTAAQPGHPAIVPDTLLHAGLRQEMGYPAEPAAPAGRIGHWCFDTATPIVGGTYEAARAAVDVALTAADLIMAGEPAVYALCRPPGHHAARSVFGGYCYFNNAALAAEWLGRQTGEPVAILDLDYHHGNGTQQLFWTRADVLYVSLHADPALAYPFFSGYADETGGGPGAGATVNLPLPLGTEDGAYFAALGVALQRISEHPGSTLVVSLGADTFGGDPICGFRLTGGAFHRAGEEVSRLGRRLLVVQEGGYAVDHLGGLVRDWLRGAEGRPAA